MRRLLRTGAFAAVHRRKENPKGPVAVFGSDYVNDRTGDCWRHAAQNPKLRRTLGRRRRVRLRSAELCRRETQHASRFATRCQRSTDLFRWNLVVEYLRTLEKIGVVEQVK